MNLRDSPVGPPFEDKNSREEERQMGVQEKSAQYSDQVKMKWWYWPVLILGSVMVVGGIVWAVAL